ncbi:MAG: ATP-dependent DNA ligase [Candidatus Peribacteraceae bacterium]|nr:ATP-dependent DNA ligase [Candidatus Peribacteraceae bacterium]
MTKKFPVLYAFSSKGKIKMWEVSAESRGDGAVVIKRHGYLNAKIQTNERLITKGKNIGKANETSPYEQAVSEAQSGWNKKVDEKYITELPTEDNTPTFILPMLAHPFKKRKHNIMYPALVQMKLNGVRCVAEKLGDMEIRLTSRKGQDYSVILAHIIPHLNPIMQIGDKWDGEMYKHGWSLQKISSRCRKLRPDTPELEYHVFDVISDNPCDLRMTYIETMIPDNDPIIKLVKCYSINKEEEVYKYHDGFVREGHEGVMIRNLNGEYVENHRSIHLQKYKEFIDDEFEITGYKEGDGVEKGCIVYECKTPEGIPFNVRPRGSHDSRKELYLVGDSLIGKDLTVRYQEKSDDGVPIFPVGIVIRDYE